MMDSDYYEIIKNELILIKKPLKPIYKKKLINARNINNNKVKETKYKYTLTSLSKDLKESTEKCLSILQSLNDINFKNDNTNFFCPFHENKNTSKTPSAVFHCANNTYICYSTNCPLLKKMNRTTPPLKVNSMRLLEQLSLL